jgi:hypothetical protein
MFKRIGIKKRDTSGNELTEQLLGTAQGFSCQDNIELTTLSLGHPKDFSTREKKPLIQWEDLPHDVLFYMSSFLDFKSLVSLAHINKNADFLLDINGERLNKLQELLTVFYSRKYPRNAYANGKWKRDYSITYRIQWRLVWLLLDKKHETSFKTRLDFFNFHHKTLSEHANQFRHSTDNCNLDYYFNVSFREHRCGADNICCLLFTLSELATMLLVRYSGLNYDHTFSILFVVSFIISALVSGVLSYCAAPLYCRFHEGVMQRRFINAMQMMGSPSSHQPLLRQLLNDTRLHWDSEETLQQLYDQMEQGESLPRGVTMV